MKDSMRDPRGSAMLCGLCRTTIARNAQLNPYLFACAALERLIKRSHEGFTSR
jgi:hypothetical protein